MPVATRRRLRDELNIDAELEYVYKFIYQAEFGELGSEHELCHVYLGRVDGDVHANDHEIESVRFLSATELEREFDGDAGRFTPWFKMEWLSLSTDYAEQLRRYLTN